MCFGLLIGMLLVLWGFSTIVNVLFHLNIPVFGIVFGLFLIYLGVQFITGPRRSCHYCQSESSSSSCHSTCMGSLVIKVTDENFNANGFPLEYKTVFGNSTIDLSTITPENLKNGATPVIVNVDTVFGKTELILNKSISTQIIAKSSFAKTTLPDNVMITFGSHTYRSNLNEQPLMIIHCSTVFGETEIRNS